MINHSRSVVRLNDGFLTATLVGPVKSNAAAEPVAFNPMPSGRKSG
ncbi:hypothetical protein EKH55_0795 [Sinorhizobium alkalisoli]|nr:hypothetical protein EKH55_0795 [Sinorhizobium alkalisoli]